MALTALTALLLTVGTVTSLQQGPHQERGNRMVPDFHAFNHPAQQAAGGPPSLQAGPIGKVEWVEGRPNFAPMPPPPPAPASSCSPLLLLLLLGLAVAAAALLRGKEGKDMKETKEGRSSGLPEEKEGTSRVPQRNTSPARPPRPASPHPLATSPCLHAAPAENNNVTTSATEETVEAKVEDVKNNLPDVEPATKPAAPVLEVKEAGAEMIKVEPVKVAVKCNKKNDFTIHLTTEDQVEEPMYVTKIKTFKLKSAPTQHSADVVQHGPESLLSVLLPLQLQKCEEWKTDIQTSTALLNIEGANISRLLVTLVQETGGEESLAKTMTIREYMMSISNKIIEDAVRAVREDCSLDNIRHLADTIKKYRPESAEVKTVRKL